MSTLLIKKQSKINGTGIFATQTIHKNSVFYKIPTSITAKKAKQNWAYIGNNTWVSDEEVLNYVNHSCDPCAILDLKQEPKLIAKRNINPGEEITVNYSETEKNGKKFPCNCKSKNCKKYFLKIE